MSLHTEITSPYRLHVQITHRPHIEITQVFIYTSCRHNMTLHVHFIQGLQKDSMERFTWVPYGDYIGETYKDYSVYRVKDYSVCRVI